MIIDINNQDLQTTPAMSESLDCVPQPPRRLTDDEISYIASKTNLPKELFKDIQLVPHAINEFIERIIKSSTVKIEGIAGAQAIAEPIDSLRLNLFHKRSTD